MVASRDEQMSQEICRLCQMLSRTGQFFWAVFILDHLIGFLAAYEQIPCSVTGGQDNPWLRTPLRLWAGRLLAVLIQCDTLGTPISIVIPGRIVWGHLYPANKGPSFISHQKHPSLPLLASILTFPLTCSQLKTKIKYLCWKLEMLGLKTNSSENFPLEQCP